MSRGITVLFHDLGASMGVGGQSHALAAILWSCLCGCLSSILVSKVCAVALVYSG